MHAVVGRVVHVSRTTESPEVEGAKMEAQSCFIEDCSGILKIKLWENLIGKLVYGETYQIRNVSTRVFAGEQYLTTSSNTEIEKIGALPNLASEIDFVVAEPEVVEVCGDITSVEAAISRRCGRCNAWQKDLIEKCEFHRCFRCKRLQHVKAYQPTVNASITVAGEFGDQEVMLSNSVVKRYVETVNSIYCKSMLVEYVVRMHSLEDFV